MLDVIGVNRDFAFDVSGAFRLEVPLDEGDHVLLFHGPSPTIRAHRKLRECYCYKMTLSRQETSHNKGSGRANQKARTRTALLNAAVELVRDGRPPSMPEAADKALVSIATAYRYFASAEELWWEASNAAFDQHGVLAQVRDAVDAAGSDPHARLEALVRSIGFRMVDDQMPYRQMMKVALDQWFRQTASPPGDRPAVREGRRNEQITQVIAPLEGRLPKKDVNRIAHALGIVIGAEAMVSLTDAVGLDAPAAKRTLLDAARWLLAGALAELTDGPPQRVGNTDQPGRLPV